MKTKYTQLVNYKKTILERLESNILQVNKFMKIQEEKIEKINQEIISAYPPKNGTMFELKSFNNMMIFRKSDKNREYLKLLELEEQKASLQEELKNAHIELEKVKFLESTEIQKIFKQRARQEAKDMDEISTVLYNQKSVS